MTFDFNCPNCGKSLGSIDPTGECANCPDCGERVTVSTIPESGTSDNKFTLLFKFKMQIVIQILFWIGVTACVVAGLFFIATWAIAVLEGNAVEDNWTVVIGLFWVIVAPIVLRIYVELILLFLVRFGVVVPATKNHVAVPKMILVRKV